jgi:hypothetical protein
MVFVAGTTSESDFPTTAGAYQTSLTSSRSAFVSEFTADGSALVFSTYLSGSDDTYGWGIDLDSDGNIYVAGQTTASDFPVTASAFQPVFGGYEDAFLTVFNPGGASLRYSTYLGGSSWDLAVGLRTGNPGKVYVAGQTASKNLPTSATAYKRKLKSAAVNCFVAKFDINLSAAASLLYSTYLGGSQSEDADYCQSVARDNNGHAFVTGTTVDNDFPTTSGAYQTHTRGDWDAFVSELNTQGSALLHSTYLGGKDVDWGYGVRIDGDGNAYVTGSTQSSNFPTTPGAFQPTLNGVIGDPPTPDAFVTKFDPKLSKLVYSTYLGGSGDDIPAGIFLDSARNAYVAGATDSSDFPVANATQAHNHCPFAAGNGFASTLNADGTALLFSTYMGGTCNNVGSGDAATSIVVRNNNIYVAGSSSSLNFPTTSGAFQTTMNGVQAGFVEEIGSVLP